MIFRPCFLIFLMLVSQRLIAQQGRSYYPNPHGYYYFLTPTGFSPPPGKAIYENGLIGINQYQMTSQNGNSSGIGLIPTLLLGADYMPVWVFTHRRWVLSGLPEQPRVVLNTGGFFLSLPADKSDADKERDFSLFYANCTFGTKEHNLAIGGGIAPTGLGDNIFPQAITVHGLTRLGKRSCLLTENYILHDRQAWIPCSMNGWRYWKGRTAIDIAVLLIGVPPDQYAEKRKWIPGPWIAVHHILRYPIALGSDD